MGDGVMIGMPGTRRGHQMSPFNLFGRLGNDMDHPGKGIGPVEGRPRAQDDLDPLDFIQHNGQRIPRHKIITGVEHLSAVNHDQHLVRQHLIESPGADFDLAGGDVHHIQARNHAQNLTNIGEAGLANILFGDDIDR